MPEKVILLSRSRLRALVVLLFGHDMQIQVAHARCKHGCRLISHTVNKRFVTIEACYNCPRSPLLPDAASIVPWCRLACMIMPPSCQHRTGWMCLLRVPCVIVSASRLGFVLRALPAYSCQPSNDVSLVRVCQSHSFILYSCKQCHHAIRIARIVWITAASRWQTLSARCRSNDCHDVDLYKS